jgi:hypothetical protein
MKRNLLSLTAVTFIVFLAACSSSDKGVTEQETVMATADGAAIVDTIKTSATVTAVDVPKRKVTLRMADGKKTTVKCGPEVVNFDQIKVDDRVNATITEELAVYLGKGNPPSAAGAAGVALAPVGAKPGGMVADTVQITAKVTAVDAAKRKVTLELPDGSKPTVKAGKQVDLSGIKVGDNVTVQYAESVAITMEKP